MSIALSHKWQITRINNKKILIRCYASGTGDATGGNATFSFACTPMAPTYYPIPTRAHIYILDFSFSTDDLTNAPNNNLLLYTRNFIPYHTIGDRQIEISLPLEYTSNQTEQTTNWDSLSKGALHLGRSQDSGTLPSQVNIVYTPNTNTKTYEAHITLLAKLTQK